MAAKGDSPYLNMQLYMVANASYAGQTLSLMLPYVLMLAYSLMRACKEERVQRRTLCILIPV